MALEIMGNVLSFNAHPFGSKLPKTYILPTISFINHPTEYAGHKANYILIDAVWLKWMYVIEVDILRK